MIDAEPRSVDGRVPVVALVGFLGAGKTTLLRHLLSSQEDLSGTFVILNDFGEVGIDSALIAGQHSEVVELVSGCVCCTLVIDLALTLQRVLDEFTPRRILIEASGVADPRGLAAVLGRAELRDRIALQRIVTVLDATCWEMREVFGRLFFIQLESGGLVVLNKVDLIGHEQLSTILAELRAALPEARVIPAVRCRVDPDSLWIGAPSDGFTAASMRALRDAYVTSTGEESGSPVGGDDEHAHVHADDAGYVALAFEHREPLDEARFRGVVASLPFEVFRLKGTVRFPDRTDVINLVGGHGDWQAWNGEPATRLALVGWGLDGSAILHELAACVVASDASPTAES